MAEIFSVLITDLNHQRLETHIILIKRNKKTSLLTYIVRAPKWAKHREYLKMIQGEKRGTIIRLLATIDAMLSHCSCKETNTFLDKQK